MLDFSIKWINPRTTSQLFSWYVSFILNRKNWLADKYSSTKLDDLIILWCTRSPWDTGRVAAYCHNIIESKEQWNAQQSFLSHSAFSLPLNLIILRWWGRRQRERVACATQDSSLQSSQHSMCLLRLRACSCKLIYTNDKYEDEVWIKNERDLRKCTLHYVAMEGATSAFFCYEAHAILVKLNDPEV